VVGLIIQPGEPAGQPVHGGLGLWILINEVTQPLGQPAERYLLTAAPFFEFLDSAVSEVQRSSADPGEDRIDDCGLLGGMRLA
jgi:hypothetical protein